MRLLTLMAPCLLATSEHLMITITVEDIPQIFVETHLLHLKNSQEQQLDIHYISGCLTPLTIAIESPTPTKHFLISSPDHSVIIQVRSALSQLFNSSIIRRISSCESVNEHKPIYIDPATNMQENKLYKSNLELTCKAL